MERASYYRARIFLIELLLNQLPVERGEKNSPRELLKQGYISPEIYAKGNPYDYPHADSEKGLINAMLFMEPFSDEDLSLVELASYSTWYAMHPEKQAGEEVVTSSIHFPITIKGTKEEIVETINRAIDRAKRPAERVNPDHMTEGYYWWYVTLTERVLMKVTNATPDGYRDHIKMGKVKPHNGRLVDISDYYQYAKMDLRPATDQDVIDWQADPEKAGQLTDQPKNSDNSRKRLAIAKAKAIKIKLHLLNAKETAMKHRKMANGLAGLPATGIDFTATLGALPRDTQQRLDDGTLGRILQRQEQEKKQSRAKTLSFEEVMEAYNKGISKEEIRAWVWYNRSIGSPMTAWKKYFLKSDKGATERLAYAKSTTEVYDNNWLTTGLVPAGTVLGKPSKKTHEYNSDTYQFFTDPDGKVCIAKQSTIAIKNSGQQVDEKELIALVEKGTLYYHQEQYLPYPIYAYGNMYDRELSLQQDRDHILTTWGKDVYDRHVEVVESRKPPRLSILNTDPNERQKITPFSSFAKKTTITGFAEDSGITYELGTDNEGNPQELSLRDAFRHWLNSRSNNELGVLSAYQIWYYLVEGKSMRSMSDDEKNTIALYGSKEMEHQFSEFLHKGLLFDDQQRLDFAWNRLYNGFSDVPYSRIPVGFTCSRGFMLSDHLEFTPAQREAIAFMQAAGSGIVAYDVGVGKTIGAIITIANAFAEGKMKRAFIVVPNPTYAKWKREIFGYEHPKTKKFYPGVLSHTGITLNDWYNLGKGFKEKIDFKKAVPENSITLLTYEGFAKIGFSQKVIDELFIELSDALSQRGDEDKSQRDFEKKQERHRELIGVGNKDTIADIDTLGFDFMVVDEAHNFKNVFASSPTDDEGVKRYNIEGGESARALKAFFLANFIQRRFGRNVMLLTATPFTNSPLEIYSMLSLVAYDKMRAMGIQNLQTFMETFIVQDIEYTNNYDGTVVMKAVVRRFNNRLVLQKIIHNHITYKTGEDAGVKRPCKINLPRLYTKVNGQTQRLPKENQIVTYLEQTDLQRAAQAQINALAMDKGNLGNIFRAMGMSLDNALSPFMFPAFQAEDYMEFVLGSPKIKYTVDCIASVKKHHEAKGEPVSGQVIYANRGKDFFPWIQQYLLDEVGFQRGVTHDRSKFDEVELITGSVSNTRKEKIKDAFLAGVVKVIIGTATISEGIDLQKCGSTLYILQPDWNPTSIRQVEGRIHRQGNKFGYVRIVMPLVQDSMDVFVFQKLDEKSARINDIWYRSDRGNVLDQESLDPEEVKFALYTNMEELTKIEIDKERKEIDRRLGVAKEQYDLMVRLDVKVRQFNDLQEQLRGVMIQMDSSFLDGLIENDGENRFSIRRHVTGNAYYGSDKSEANKLWRAFIEQVEGVRKDIQTFNESSTKDDKELVRLCRRIVTVLDKSQQTNAMTQLRAKVSDFKMSLAEIRKVERTTLAQRNLTLQDNFQPVIDDLNREIEAINAELEATRDPAFYEARLREVMDKKARLTIQGLTIPDLVKQFSELNYLLDYKAQDINAAACDLPGKGQDRRTGKLLPAATPTKPTEDRDAVARDKKLRLAKAKAKALKIKLRLLAADG